MITLKRHHYETGMRIPTTERFLFTRDYDLVIGRLVFSLSVWVSFWRTSKRLRIRIRPEVGITA